MLEAGKKWMVVSDLDGTLLDHHDYSFAEVLPVLHRLKAAGIPLVVNTSKTRAEWLAMRGDFENEDPFIVENGSALYEGEEVTVYGKRREEIWEIVQEVRAGERFQAYAEVGVTEVMAWTGLDRAAAERSSEREFSEPLKWEDSAEKEAEFCERIKDRGLMTLRGGRFLHVLGATDKGVPMAKFREQGYHIVALGDRENDLAMLEQAEVGVVIANSEGYFLEGDGFLRSSATGPRGWVEVMGEMLKC